MSAETQKKRIADFLATEWTRLVGYVRSLISDAADRDAEDIVQDVLAGLFERADVTTPIADLSAYLYRSLRNRIVDAYRKPRRTVPLAAAVTDSRYEASGEVERKLEREALFSAIESLPAPQRAVFLATEWEGMSYAELADEWETPMGTLLARKYRAVRALRKALEGGTQ